MIFRLKNKIFDLKKKPVIMGILNITPDSFSDGSQYTSMDKALFQAEKMQKEGADIIDIGGESSRPGADLVTSDEEINRIYQITEKIKEKFDLPVSIDTYKEKTAEIMLDLGCEMINDIYGLTKSPEIASIVAKHDAALCLMHMRGTPKTMQSNTDYDNLLNEISVFLKETGDFALKKGVAKESILIDPGIGFGKSVEDNLKILKNIHFFIEKTSFQVLIGTSRKSFIGKILNKTADNRLSGTIASNVIALANGAKIFRVHDVAEHRDALDLAFELI